MVRELKCSKHDYQLFSSRGFSLGEVMVTIALMAVLSAVALPSFFDWRKNMYYKQAAADVANALKTARSKAITLNQQYGVLFTTTDRSFQFRKYSTNQWVNSGSKGYLSNKVILNLNPTAASAVTPLPNIRFDINGASFDNYSVTIRDVTSSKYLVSVERSGRIRISKEN